MNLSDAEAFLRRHTTASVLAGFLLVFAGVDLLLNPTHLQNSEVLGIPFLVAGLALFALLFRRTPGAPAHQERRTPASRFLDIATIHGNLIRRFPAFATLLIPCDLASTR